MIKLNQILKTYNNESKYIYHTSEQLSCPQIAVQTEEPTLTYLINKVADIAVANRDAGLVIAAAIGTSVILWAIADAAAKLIKAARS